MEQFLPILVIIVIVVIIVFSAIHAMERTKEMNEWGDQNGLEFTKKDRYMDDEFPQYSCLHRGHSRYAKNILTGAVANMLGLLASPLTISAKGVSAT